MLWLVSGTGPGVPSGDLLTFTSREVSSKLQSLGLHFGIHALAQS